MSELCPLPSNMSKKKKKLNLRYLSTKNIISHVLVLYAFLQGNQTKKIKRSFLTVLLSVLELISCNLI